MTSSDAAPGASRPAPAASGKDRSFRSVPGMFAGGLLLAIGLWLGIDALVVGDGRARLVAGSLLLVGLPLVTAFTLRPVVHADDARMEIRNPLRTITLPWGTVTTIRARYSTEVFAGSSKYQLWAVPVSMRARKRAGRQMAQRANARGGLATRFSDTFGNPAGSRRPHPGVDPAAPADAAVRELTTLAERNAGSPAAQGEVAVRWAWEIIVPAVVGAVAFVVTLLV